MGIVGPHISGHNERDNKPSAVLELCVHRPVPGTCYQAATCPVARQRLGRDKAGQCDAAGDRLPVNTPSPPPRHCPANPPDINTAATPITDGSPAPGSQWPVSPQPPRQCANMRGRSSGRGSQGAAGGRGSSQTLAGRVETQTRDTALSHRAGTQAV